MLEKSNYCHEMNNFLGGLKKLFCKLRSIIIHLCVCVCACVRKKVIEVYRCSGLNGRDFDRFIACVNGYVNLKTLVIVFNDVTEWVCDYLICWLIYLN